MRAYYKQPLSALQQVISETLDAIRKCADPDGIYLLNKQLSVAGHGKACFALWRLNDNFVDELREPLRVGQTRARAR